jgi:hypothetical protein
MSATAGTIAAMSGQCHHTRNHRQSYLPSLSVHIGYRHASNNNGSLRIHAISFSLDEHASYRTPEEQCLDRQQGTGTNDLGRQLLCTPAL